MTTVIVTDCSVHAPLSYVDVPSGYMYEAQSVIIGAQAYYYQAQAFTHGRFSGAAPLIFKPFSP